MTSGSLTYRTRPARGEPRGALVLMHGRGADEADLEPLVDVLDRTGRLIAFLPRGPLSLPPGGAHWYVVRRVGYPDESTFHPTFERLAAWFDAVLADAGVAPGRAILGGFSQGAVMAYALALAADRPRPAAILALSGFVPRVAGLELDAADRAGLPVFISHGTRDGVIAVEWGRDARDLLAGAGLAVTYREEPAGHTITAGALAEAERFLAAIVE
ncbi:MAG: phospholipase [Actinomycetota bacterium]|nr:phospholipase [Actinomycetota bacterium]